MQRPLWKRLVLLVLGWRFFLFVLLLFAIRVWGFEWSFSTIAFGSLGLWDGYWHQQIAQYGYFAPGLTLRFPLYPFLIRVLTPVFGGDSLVAALSISLLSLFGAVAIFHKLAHEELGGEGPATRSLILLLVFPTAFFFAAAYAESLFLLFSVASFLMFRRGRLVASSLLGGLAALTRPQGILLFPSFLLARLLQKRRLGRDDLAFLLIPLMVVPWLVFLWERFGNPFLFLSDLSLWGEGPWQRAREMTSPLTVFTSYLSDIPLMLRSLGDGMTSAFLVQLKELSDFVFFLGFFVLGVYVARFFDLSYSLYMFFSLALMLAVGTLKGAPRFVLVLFPAFLALSKLLRRPWAFLLVVSAFTIGLVALLLVFSLHYWVA